MEGTGFRRVARVRVTLDGRPKDRRLLAVGDEAAIVRQLIARFRHRCQREGLLADIRASRICETPGQRRRRKRLAAKRGRERG